MQLKFEENNFDFRINIVGDGRDLDKMKSLVSSKNLQNYFSFFGFVTSSKLKDEIFELSDIMIFPSYYKEGFPYVILEGMLFKLPIISTSVGSLADIVEDGESGFLIAERNEYELEKAMRYFINNPFRDIINSMLS